MNDVDLLQEYMYEYELFVANQEVNEQLFQLECGYLNESTGLISLQESLIDTLKGWFEKIVNAITGVIEKLQTKLGELFDNQLAKLEPIVNNPNKNPESFNIPITNYHGYDFTKFADGTYDTNKSFTNPEFANIIAGLVGGGTGQVPEKLSKKDILQAVYPNLYDPEGKLSVYDKMKESLLKTGKDNNEQTILNREILDEAWKFVSVDRRNLIEQIKKDKEAIKNQKKNIDSATQQLMNTVQSTQTTQTTNTTPTTDTQESFVFCEGYLLLEKDEEEKDVKDQKVGGPEGENGVSRETYVRALMTYIQVATDILSAKTKVVNSAFLDKLRIILYYAKRAK